MLWEKRPKKEEKGKKKKKKKKKLAIGICSILWYYDDNYLGINRNTIGEGREEVLGTLSN